MAQYASGKIIVTEGSPTVRAAWEALVSGATDTLRSQGRLNHLSSGARSRVIAHVLGTSNLLFDLVSGTPVSGETVDGPGQTNYFGSTATTVSSNQLFHAGQTWGTDEHANRWVGIRIGQANEEWRRIVTNTATLLTVDANWTVGGAGVPYGIYNAAQAVISGWLRGTPQDFVAAGVAANHLFVAELNTPIAIQSGVAASQFTLAAPWGGASADGVAFAIHKDFTARGFPILAQGDAKPNAIVGRLAAMVDAAFTLSWTAVTYQNGWATAAPLGVSYAKDSSGYVVLRGAAFKAGTPPAQETIFVLPTGFRPGRKIYFAVVGNAATAVVSVDTDGATRFESGATTTALQFSQVTFGAA